MIKRLQKRGYENFLKNEKQEWLSLQVFEKNWARKKFYRMYYEGTKEMVIMKSMG